MLNGRLVVFVDPKNTTKQCSACGNIKDMSLKERVYDCCVCGLNISRDLNSAINIQAKGFSLFEELNSFCLAGTPSKS